MISLAACEPAPQDQPSAQADLKTIIYLGASTAHNFGLAQRLAIAHLAGRNKKVTLQCYDAEGQAEKQLSQWRDAVAAKPFAIVVDAIDPPTLTPLIHRAAGTGSFIIGLGNAMAEKGCSTVVWCDQRELGRLAGEVAIRALTMKATDEGNAEVRGRVVQIQGDEESPACLERSEGFIEGLRSAPGIILVHDAPGGWTREGAGQRVEEALRLQKHFDVVYAHNDEMALGAAQAAGSLRESALFIGTDGIDGPNGGMSLVDNGDIDATIFQPLLVDFAWSVISKRLLDPAFKPKPSYQLTPRAITAKDLDDVRLNGLPKFPEL